MHFMSVLLPVEYKWEKDASEPARFELLMSRPSIQSIFSERILANKGTQTGCILLYCYHTNRDACVRAVTQTGTSAFWRIMSWQRRPPGFKGRQVDGAAWVVWGAPIDVLMPFDTFISRESGSPLKSIVADVKRCWLRPPLQTFRALWRPLDNVANPLSSSWKDFFFFWSIIPLSWRAFSAWLTHRTILWQGLINSGHGFSSFTSFFKDTLRVLL